MSPLPAGIQTVTVTGSEFGGGGGATGSIDFIPVRVLYAALKEIGLPTTYKAPLIGGAFSIALPAADDPGANPQGASWRVVERVKGGSSYNISLLLANGATQDLSVLAPVTSDTGTPVIVGPRGPRGFEISVVDHNDGSFTLTVDESAALVDHLDGTFTLTLAA